MQELRVVFDPSEPPGYRASLASADGVRLGVEVPLMPFLAEEDHESLRWYLEEFMDLPDGGAVTRAQRIERDLARWGRRLHDTLFTAQENRALLDELLTAPEPRCRNRPCTAT